ncbi:hypothetical protein OCU04_006288 [Sclerotinia nivalis]|uniref:Uncharacterized protein n=1 Tax=Sclerotinia nivalis TaxID=352851 RepID=A0A9X0DM14_9HELO|nr:hypothetical protein OCU04_006288 [Sclerotinia nivalis]
MKLGLELFDLGQERVEKSTKEKLDAAKKSLTDRSFLAVSRINKTIARENATQSFNIPMQNWKVSLEACQKCFNEENSVVDEKARAATRRAEARTELERIEDKISETLGFQSPPVSRSEDRTLKDNTYLHKIVASNSLDVRKGFFGKRKNVKEKWIHLEGLGQLDKEVIRLRNIACHDGHIDLDFAHYKLFGWGDEDACYTDFEDIYGISPRDYEPLFETSQKVSQMYNMRATMFKLFYQTEYTYDKEADTHFEKIFGECRRIYAGLDKRWSAAEKGRYFDREDTEIAKDVMSNFYEMEGIVEATKCRDRLSR